MDSHNSYHILNGDALKERFPREIEGERIIMRECLVDGPVGGRSIEELLKTRAKFLSTEYGGTETEYFSKVAVELKKIVSIPTGSSVYLWFEDDLFCQANLWFVLHLLASHSRSNQLYLVRPKIHSQYGFGAYQPDELSNLLSNRIRLTRIEDLSKLWSYYQNGELSELRELAVQLSTEYPFLLQAVVAHIERIPSKNSFGRPTEVIKQIINELGTSEFGPIFREFSKRESVYGFGDLQVKRIFDDLIDDSN